MGTIKNILILLLAVLAIQSCGTSSDVYKVKNISSDYKPQTVINDFFDEESKIGYTILKDSSNLYVNLSTLETASQLKILNNGVKVFFDKEGVENETSYLQFPMTSELQNKSDHNDLKSDKSAFLNKKIAELNDEILFVENNNQDIINRKLNSKGISSEMFVYKEELYYQIKFPLTFIANNNDEYPSLGINIKGIKRTESSETRSNNDSAPKGSSVSSGGRGSGGRGGGGRGGRGGGGGRSGDSNTNDRSSNTTPNLLGLSSDVKIWIKIGLNQ